MWHCCSSIAHHGCTAACLDEVFVGGAIKTEQTNISYVQEISHQCKIKTTTDLKSSKWKHPLWA